MATPSEIEKLGDRAVRIVWEDGHVTEFPNAELRFLCACAVCVDEWTGERRLERRDVPAAIVPTGVQLVGNYAVHFEWSDGHATGIYTYDALRAHCPCPQCKAARGAA